MLPRVLPLEDEDVRRARESRVQARPQGLTSDQVSRRRPVAEGGVVLGCRQAQLEADVLLVAVGRRPVTENWASRRPGSSSTAATSSRPAHAHRSTGDLRHRRHGADAALAHVASAEGILAVEHVAGLDPRPIDYDQVPSCTYCDPRWRASGSPRRRRGRRGHDVVTGKFPFIASARRRSSAAAWLREDGARDQVRRAPRRPHHRPARHRADRRGLHRAAARGDRRGSRAPSTPTPPCPKLWWKRRASPLVAPSTFSFLRTMTEVVMPADGRVDRRRTITGG